MGFCSLFFEVGCFEIIGVRFCLKFLILKVIVLKKGSVGVMLVLETL